MTDLAAPRDKVAEATWPHHRGTFTRQTTLAWIGPSWLMVHRGLAKDAIRLLGCPGHGA